MPNKTAFLALGLALLALGIFGLGPSRNGGNLSAKKETAFDRVMQTRTLRCAYITRSHHFETEAAAKQMSGIDYEVMEEIGKLTHLKIEWVEETGVGVFPELLSSGKADAACVLIWTNPVRAARVIATAPVMYTPVYAYVRADDARFDNNIDAVNDEKVTISVADSGTMKAIADSSFPKAKQLSLPGLSNEAQLILNVATKKADLTFADELAVYAYNKNNPDKQLKHIDGVGPVRTYFEAYNVAMGEWGLRELLSVAINELHNNGTINRILSKYENVPGEILRVTMPYSK